MRRLILVPTALLLFAACATYKPCADPAPRLLMETTAGTMTLKLFPSATPKTVAQMIRLSEAGVFDSVYYWRVVPGFVAQNADAEDREVPMTEAQKALIKPIPFEPNPIKHTRGMLSMAHWDDPNTGETSFSIMLADVPRLDGKFAIFGMLEDSEETLRVIEQRYDKDAKDKDGNRLQIRRMTVAPECR